MTAVHVGRRMKCQIESDKMHSSQNKTKEPVYKTYDVCKIKQSNGYGRGVHEMKNKILKGKVIDGMPRNV